MIRSLDVTSLQMLSNYRKCGRAKTRFWKQERASGGTVPFFRFRDRVLVSVKGLTVLSHISGNSYRGETLSEWAGYNWINFSRTDSGLDGSLSSIGWFGIIEQVLLYCVELLNAFPKANKLSSTYVSQKVWIFFCYYTFPLSRSLTITANKFWNPNLLKLK